MALAEDSGTQGGELVGVKFTWTEAGNFVDSFFDVFVELLGDSPYLYKPELSALPGLQVGGESFALTMPVLLRDSGGSLSASSVAIPLNGELRDATRGFNVWLTSPRSRRRSA